MILKPTGILFRRSNHTDEIIGVNDRVLFIVASSISTSNWSQGLERVSLRWHDCFDVIDFSLDNVKIVFTIFLRKFRENHGGASFSDHLMNGLCPAWVELKTTIQCHHKVWFNVRIVLGIVLVQLVYENITDSKFIIFPILLNFLALVSEVLGQLCQWAFISNEN